MSDVVLLVLGLVLGTASLVLAIRLRGQHAAPPFQSAAREPSWPVSVLVVFAIVLIAQLLFRSGLVFLQGGDEYCRLSYAFWWARDPFFAPADHTWLAGHFYAPGMAYRPLGSLPLTVTVTSLLGMWTTVYFAMVFARRVWGSAHAAIFAGVLVGTEWILLWASANSYAEVFFYPAFVGSLAAWTCAWQSGNPAAERTRKTGVNVVEGVDLVDKVDARASRTDAWLLLSAACVGFGNMFRYEMWYLGVLLGAFLAVRAIRLLADPRRRNIAWIPLLGCALIAAYPVAWAISCRIHLGSFLAFLSKMTAENRRTNLFYDFSSVWSTIIIYPTVLILDHWPQLGLAFGGFCLLFVAVRRPVAPVAIPVPALLITGMVLTMKSGIGSNNRPRFTEFLVLPLLCFGAGSLALLWQAGHGARRAAARVVVAAFLVLAVTTSLKLARASYPHSWGEPPDVLQLMIRLEREHDAGRPQNDCPIIHPEGRKLAIYFAEHYVEFWMAQYHSAFPERVHPLFDADQLRDAFGYLESGDHLLIRTPSPAVPPASRFIRLETIGPFELWEARSQ